MHGITRFLAVASAAATAATGDPLTGVGASAPVGDAAEPSSAMLISLLITVVIVLFVAISSHRRRKVDSDVARVNREFIAFHAQKDPDFCAKHEDLIKQLEFDRLAFPQKLLLRLKNERAKKLSEKK